MTLEVIPDVGNNSHQGEACGGTTEDQAEYPGDATEERTPRWVGARWRPIGWRGPVIHASRVRREVKHE
jgi:hypothetical protein